jgi:hypothetical protein
MDIDTKIKLDMNSGTAAAPTVVIKPAHPPAGGSIQDPPWLPNSQETKPAKPLGFTDVSVAQETSYDPLGGGEDDKA